ncbi:MAG: DUF4838 domain-containing protein [Phycisphaeraceae bacterium]|nr:DUF4838 domain-containing protein [Phycisphaeraceae bacterium]
MRTVACVVMTLILSAWTVQPVAGEPGKLTLVRDGQPACAIVIARQATRAAQLGAYEVQAHLKAITGATVPILTDDDPAATNQSRGSRVRILIGDSACTRALGFKAESFTAQQYAVNTLGDDIVLMGRDKPDTGKVSYDFDQPATLKISWPDVWDDRGSLDACYDFLVKGCGVRWFNPTDFGMVCPSSATLEVAIADIRRAPAFEYRDSIGSIGYENMNYDAQVALWPASSPQFKAYEAQAYVNLHSRHPDTTGYINAKRAQVQLFRLRMRDGGVRVLCNHSFIGYYDRFLKQNPARPELFVESRPDWFAQGYQGLPPHLCYSNPQVIAQVAQDARDYFDGKKTGKDLGIFFAPTLPNPFPLEPMDDPLFCKCDACQARQNTSLGDVNLYAKGIHSEYWFHFVNDVAREVARTHPNQMLVTLAYMTHSYPPVSFKVMPNVAVEFCFAAGRLPYSADYKQQLTLVESWAKQGNPMYMWLYDGFPVAIANSGKFNCWPGFIAHTRSEQMKLFHKLGYRGFFHCGFGGQEVDAYITYQMMNDPDQDVDVLLDEYFKGLYGPAGEPMRKMYRLIEETYRDPANYSPTDGHQTMKIAWNKLGTAERMSQLAAWMEQAKAGADTDVRKQRVALFEMSVWDYMVAGRKQYLERASAPIPAVNVPRTRNASTDLAKLDWSQAASLGPWYVQSRGMPAARALTGKAIHDGKNLYLELTDPCATTRLVTSPGVFPFDDWEIFTARLSELPYRHFSVGPAGEIIALTYGEVNWQMHRPYPDHGITASSDASQPGLWVIRLAIPLTSLAADGITPGSSFHMNIVRVTSPAVAGGDAGIESFVPFSRVHEVDRLALFNLAP